MPAPTRFTVARRERLLGMVLAGATLEAACAEVGISRTTVDRWIAKGRRAPDSPAGEFAEELRRARAQAPDADAPEAPGPLTIEELVKLLERQARDGKMGAIELLLKRPWEAAPPPATGKAEPAKTDGWDALDADTEAGPPDELTPRRRARAQAVAPKRRRRRVKAS